MVQPGYALITGASSGIGECFARALAARQRNLVLVARSLSKLEALAKELRNAHSVEVEPVGMDLSSEGAAKRLVQLVNERKLWVNILVNNAGFGAQGEFWKLSLECQTEMLRLNIQALVELTYLLLAPMLEQGRGAIVNVSSTASFQPVPYTSVYSATKAFVTSFSLALAEEVRRYGVSVITLCPGGTRTNFFEASQYYTRNFATGLQSPEEVVKAALRALDRSGGLVVPGSLNKLSVASLRLAPRGIVVKVAGKMFRPKGRA
jgi:short-subunit dehydrogenase